MHRVQVDQSGLIGKTSVNTVLAFSDQISYAILIPARVKRAGLEYLRRRRPPFKLPYLKLFAAGLFLLLKDHLHQLELVTIDTEFTGLEGHIKGMLLRYIRRIDPSFSKDKITFRRIGKGSRAHLKAIETYRENLKPDRVVTQEELLALL